MRIHAISYSSFRHNRYRPIPSTSSKHLLGEGIIPIIAHPERNRAIAEKPARLERLVRHGALAQITAGSLAGHFGKNVQKLSLQLIEANLVHTYGSDVHNVDTRPLLFNKGLDYLEKKKHHDLADILLENNERIVQRQIAVLIGTRNT